jgi:hypothetical protein
MQGREKNARNSWVVNKATRLPTEYTEADTHPDLTSNSDVLELEEELVEWLESLTTRKGL